MAKIKAGKYIGKISSAGLYEPKSKIPMVCIQFEFQDVEGELHNLTWYGSMHDNSKEFTIQTMVTCGFSGDDLIDCLKGKEVFDTTKELELVVGIKETQDGKQRPEIKFINNTGGSSFKQMDVAQAKSITQGYSIKGDLMAARQVVGAVKPKQEEVSEQDILF